MSITKKLTKKIEAKGNIRKQLITKKLKGIIQRKVSIFQIGGV
jgi:hypothetical protein